MEPGQAHVAAVSDIYAAFAAGDAARILAHVAEDADWEYGGGTPGVPWLQPRRGRAGAAEFLASLGAMRLEEFRVKAVLGQGALVFGVVDIAFTVPATGRRVVEEDEIHLWWFDGEGRVARFRHRADTLLQAWACGAAP